MAILLRLKEIENEFGKAQRLESTLLQQYEVLDEFKKKEFVIALIGKVIGLDRRLYQAAIAERLIAADKMRADFITLPQLIHDVCYSVPVATLAGVLARWDCSAAADYAVGNAYSGAVIYPCWSLVDHDDGESVERYPDGSVRSERRRAW